MLEPPLNEQWSLDMAAYTVKLPDVGEGIAQAEIVAWHVVVGDPIHEDQVIAEIMTDKATVELPSPIDGVITWLGGEVGDILSVGADLLRIETKSVATPADEPATQSHDALPESDDPRSLVRQPVRALAAPAVRDRARRMAIELDSVTGSGPGGRITHQDLDEAITKPCEPAPSSSARLAVGEALVGGEAHPAGARSGAKDVAPEVERIKIIGLRRNIAERMQLSKRRIPHFTYVEEVDVTELERLRQQLNSSPGNSAIGFPGSQGVDPVGSPANDQLGGRIKLTVLPFVMRAVLKALALHPQMNARFDDDAGVLERYSEVRLGIAVQTAKGLMVPVVKGMRTLDLWESAAEVTRLSELARTSKIKIEDLIGSTITITSLGPLGGIASTPVINYPEVAVIGVNKIVERAVYVERELVPRKIMNLSSSFDHRVIDGADAAAFIQVIKSLLETPALLFV